MDLTRVCYRDNQEFREGVIGGGTGRDNRWPAAEDRLP